MKSALILSALAAIVPSGAVAQSYACKVPPTLNPVRPDRATAEQPQRIVPIGGYTLALSWAPQYCREHRRDPKARFQCGGGNRFGFVLHGLWPDGVGKEWPQYCRATALLPEPVIRATLCVTPSAQLLQHEWAKHGTCMPGVTPASYFTRASALYRRLRYPDMTALSRRPQTAGSFAVAMARANPGMAPAMMRITATRAGWLDEVWICLDKSQRYARCPVHQGGLPPTAGLKIWRGGR